MFTGIVQIVGVIVALEPSEVGAVIRLKASDWGYSPHRGDSIAINGCCLTVVEATDLIRFDVIHQTLKITTLGNLKEGNKVNLEHAATPSTLLGGHIVQGHIDGIAWARQVESVTEGEVKLRIEPATDLMDYIIPKGSITVDGISLTIAEVGENWFEVALIPTTLQLTNLNEISDIPKQVNLEVDCMVKAVVHYLKRQQGKINPN